MKYRTGYEHGVNDYGGYRAKCTFCNEFHLWANAEESDDWWAIHEVSTAHVERAKKRKRRG